MPGRRIIGVDVGATKLLAGAVDTDFFVHRRVQRSVSGLEQSSLLDAIAIGVHEVAALAGGEIEAIGFSLPGRIDSAAGSIAGRHPALRDAPFAAIMAERLGLPAIADHAGNLAALAEHRAGAARGADNAIVLTVGDAISAGVIRHGELHRGVSELAGIEPLASDAALTREAQRIASARPASALASAQRELQAALVIELAHDGDAAAREALALIGTRLGAEIARLADTLHPEVVVIAGDVLGAGELLLAPTRTQLDVPVVAAQFGVEAAMVGAATLARECLTAGNPA